MTTRQPLHPISPPSATAVKSRYAHLQRPTLATTTTTTTRTNGLGTMDTGNHDRHDLHDADSVVSGLSELENDAEDDFDKLMIRNERDRRRLSQAASGRPQPFTKARTHPRVGLTLENLERNNAAATAAASANVSLDRPPSSSGSTSSNPAIHVPATWGRKGRSNRHWMRAIAYDEDQQQQTPTAPEEDGTNDQYYGNSANLPHRSVEDSPLSRKTSMVGTPRAESEEWDLTFELNEASMIASTPYISRSTVLDDIRRREIESSKERSGSPEPVHRRSSFARKAESASHGASNPEPVVQESPPPQKKLRMRTQSWQSIGKSQSVMGVGKEDMPSAMYKSTESIAEVDREVVATAERIPPKRVPHRRHDSQDLLRRLARASNTPSPARPQTTPPDPLDGSSETATTRTQSSGKERMQNVEANASVPKAASEPVAPASQVDTEREGSRETPQEVERLPESSSEKGAKTNGVDATPMPAKRPILNPKTPVVTGAWVDTPGPRTTQRSVSTSRSRSRSRSPKKVDPRKTKSLERLKPSAEGSANIAMEVVRPQLPRSALQALVEEAKAHDKQSTADFGDSTINSLEELITPLTEIAVDEDTLQGLQIPTDAPRNDAERQRQQELVHLHRMSDRLRAARTSIRDVSRGMKRVEDRVEHVEEGENGEKIKMVKRTCLCTSEDHVQYFSMWKWWKSLFWEQRLKSLRQVSNSRLRFWGGLTGLSIFLITLFVWWLSEEIACELYCRPVYAHSYPYPFSVNPNAPKYPYVIPTLIYRNLIKDWWVPVSSFFSWLAATIWGCVFGFEQTTRIGNYMKSQSMQSSGVVETHWMSEDAATLMEERGWDASIFNDEIMPGGR